MFRYMACLGWLIVALVAANCGGSREPVLKEKATAVSDAGIGTKVDSGSAAEASIATCSGLGAFFADFNIIDPNALSTLRETGKTIGVAVSARHLSEVAYAAAAREFNSLTPENEMKWETTESSPELFSFADADNLVRFAAQNQMQVRGHTLVWHSQLPHWVSQLTDADSVRLAMTRHINTVVGHFRDQFPRRVVAWDVVNEALESVNGVVSYRNSPFYLALGEGFIAEAFRLAHAADPTALLYYNDFGIEGLGAKATATFDMLSALLAQGVPISGVGFQMHTRAEDRGPTMADLTANLARYAQLGLRVNISEMDATLCDAPGSVEERLDLQRVRFNAVAAACFQSGICDDITIWGVTDAYTWLNDRTPCTDATVLPSPLLFDNAVKRKPAWVGLRDALLGCYY